MSGKVIFTTGSFSGSLGIDASGNINIDTFQNSKKLILDGVKAISGSVEQDIDKATGKVIKEKVKDISAGTEIIRSGSATTNQIMMQQNPTGAYITVSGSTSGFNIIKTGTNEWGVWRATSLLMKDVDNNVWTQGIKSSGDYHINNAISLGDTASAELVIENDGNVRIPQGDLRVTGSIFASGNVTAQNYIVKSSVTAVTTSFSSGSTIFGDSSTDTHQFTGSLYVTEDLYTDVIRRNTSNPTKVNVKLNSAGIDIHTDHATKRKAHFGSTSSVTGSFNVSQNLTVGKDLTGVRSASITYITASTVDVDGDTIRIGGEAITKNDWKNIKEGKFSSVAGTGDITLSGSLIPSVNASKTGGFTLGTKDKRWSKLFVASTIDVSGSQLIISPSASIAAGDDFTVIISGSVIPANTGSDSLGSLAKPFALPIS